MHTIHLSHNSTTTLNIIISPLILFLFLSIKRYHIVIKSSTLFHHTINDLLPILTEVFIKRPHDSIYIRKNRFEKLPLDEMSTVQRIINESRLLFVY